MALGTEQKLPPGIVKSLSGQLWDFRDFKTIKKYKPSGLTRKESRAYNRLVTGLTIGDIVKAEMRFLTLTTAPFVTSDINKDFDALKKRIARATFAKDGFRGFKFNKYFKLKTSEGYGVLHIIFWGGRFIPKAWLSQAWKELHNSPIVDIKLCYDPAKGRKKGLNGLVGYLLTNYLTRQPIIRMSSGWGWSWLGVCKSWKNTLKTYGYMRRSSKQDLVALKFHKPEHSHYEYCSNYPKGDPPFSFRHPLEAWQKLLHAHPVTSRQIKFCNPSHDRYSRRWEWIY